MPLRAIPIPSARTLFCRPRPLGRPICRLQRRQNLLLVKTFLARTLDRMRHHVVHFQLDFFVQLPQRRIHQRVIEFGIGQAQFLAQLEYQQDFHWCAFKPKEIKFITVRLALRGSMRVLVAYGQ